MVNRCQQKAGLQTRNFRKRQTGETAKIAKWQFGRPFLGQKSHRRRVRDPAFHRVLQRLLQRGLYALGGLFQLFFQCFDLLRNFV